MTLQTRQMKLFEAKKKLDQATKLFEAAGLDLNELLEAKDENVLASHIEASQKELESAIEATAQEVTELTAEVTETKKLLDDTLASIKAAGVEFNSDESFEEALKERISTAAQEQLSALGHEPVADDVNTDPEAPKAETDIVTKWQAITDPSEKTTFYNKNRSKIIAQFN